MRDTCLLFADRRDRYESVGPYERNKSAARRFARLRAVGERGVTIYHEPQLSRRISAEALLDVITRLGDVTEELMHTDIAVAIPFSYLTCQSADGM